jgi:flavodoxin
MRTLVAYSSRTGNTKQLAEAIFAILPAPKMLSAIEEAPEPDDFDFIALGFWIDRGWPDAKSQRYMRTLKGQRIALFGTMGSYSDPDSALACLEHVKQIVATDNELLGSFLCQGKIAPDVIDMLSKTRPMTAARKAMFQEAAQHPTPEDLREAQESFRTILTKL